MVNLDREPTADELVGMEWWNSMSEPRRADWLRLADSARPADAWDLADRIRTIPGVARVAVGPVGR